MQADTLFDLMTQVKGSKMSVDHSDLKAAADNLRGVAMGINCGPPPKGSMCVDCFYRGKERCPFVGVHPYALACHQFTRRITDFRVAIEPVGSIKLHKGAIGYTGPIRQTMELWNSVDTRHKRERADD